VEMKFQLPPPLPEKRARRLGQAENPAHEESPKRSSDSSEAAAPVARENASALSIPAIQTSASPSKVATGISPQKPKKLSAQLVGVGIVAVSVIAVCLIILASWSRSAKSAAGDSNVALLDNTKYSSAAPSPAYVAESTASARPTVSVMRAFPPVNAAPSATPTASVMRGALVYHVVNVANGDYLNIRSGAGSAYPLVGRLAAGAGNISSTGKTRKNGNTTWVFISAGSISGWANADFLQPGDANVNPPSPTPSAIKSPPISEAAERAKYWESWGYHFDPNIYTASMMDQKAIDIDRAKYWESRGYHFDPNIYSALMMDQKVVDIDRAKYWEGRGYHFDPSIYSALMMDQKVVDIDRAKYWESRGYHFDSNIYTALMMDQEVERIKGSH
jgi:uncharacterized protein YraI